MHSFFTTAQVHRLLTDKKLPYSEEAEAQSCKTTRGPAQFNLRAHLLKQEKTWMQPVLNIGESASYTVIFSGEFELTPFYIAFLVSVFHYSDLYKVVVWDPKRSLEEILASPVANLHALLAQVKLHPFAKPEEILRLIAAAGKHCLDGYIAVETDKVIARYREIGVPQDFILAADVNPFWNKTFNLNLKSRQSFPMPDPQLTASYEVVEIKTLEAYQHLKKLFAAKVLPNVTRLIFYNPPKHWVEEEMPRSAFTKIKLQFDAVQAPSELTVSMHCRTLIISANTHPGKIHIHGNKNLACLTVNNTKDPLTIDFDSAPAIRTLRLGGPNIYLARAVPIRMLFCRVIIA